MRILLVYYEPQPSGQTRHVLSLAQGLDPARHQLTVVLPDCLQDLVPDFVRTGARVVSLPLRKVVADPRTLRALAQQIRSSGPEVVHVHSQEAGLYARIMARLGGARAIVYTPQTIDIRRGRWHWLYALAERALASITDRIVSVNEADSKRLRQWGLAAHMVITIPNGIDLREFSRRIDVAQVRRSLRASPRNPLVLQVGRLSAQKNPIGFVEGAARVIRMFPDARFALVGDGPLRDRVAQRVHGLGLEGKVHLAGWRAGASELMAAADLVTLTSLWEGAPYSLLEAMAWSKPVVATAVNGCPEIVANGVTGVLVPARDSVAWGEAAAELLRNPARAEAMGLNGRQRVEQLFTLPLMIDRTERLYQDVCGRVR
jgi:glycosyltransferase involved in cell wall biosynthesis